MFRWPAWTFLLESPLLSLLQLCTLLEPLMINLWIFISTSMVLSLFFLTIVLAVDFCSKHLIKECFHQRSNFFNGISHKTWNSVCWCLHPAWLRRSNWHAWNSYLGKEWATLHHYVHRIHHFFHPGCAYWIQLFPKRKACSSYFFGKDIGRGCSGRENKGI